MGFGGGGSGSFVLPNHKHTNVLADGGALDEAISLINDGAADVTFSTWVNAKITSAHTSPTIQRDELGANVTTTSVTFVDITGLSITVPNNTGKFLITAGLNHFTVGAGATNRFRILDNSTAYAEGVVQTTTSTINTISTLVHAGDNDGQVVKAQFLTSSGTLYCAGSASGEKSYLVSLEVE
jgi:hypothetical protein